MVTGVMGWALCSLGVACFLVGVCCTMDTIGPACSRDVFEEKNAPPLTSEVFGRTLPIGA